MDEQTSGDNQQIGEVPESEPENSPILSGGVFEMIALFRLARGDPPLALRRFGGGIR